MGREEMEIGFSIIKDPIFTSFPIIHETCQHHWLILFHIPLHKLTVIQFFPIHLLYLTSNSDSHFFSFLSLEVTKVVFFFFLARQQRLLICEISLWVLYFAGKNSFNETLKNENYIPSRLGLGCFHFSPYLGIFLLHQIWFWFKMVIRLL